VAKAAFLAVAGLLLLNGIHTTAGFARGFRYWDTSYQRLPNLVESTGIADAVVFIPNSRSAPVGAFPFVPLNHADVVYFRTGPLPQWRLDNPDWRVPYRRYFRGRWAYLFDGSALWALDATDLN
jgi:hypothetical protein